MSAKRILVTMSTGNQGSATVRALAKRNEAKPSTFEILAVTRSASSGKAKELGSLPGVTLLESDYVPTQIFDKATKGGPVHGIFGVQSAMLLPSHVPKGPPGETVLGKDLIDVAIKHNVQHFVYTSVDQGGLPKTDIPHFESKRFIEEYLVTKATSMKYTILRPVAFMDNISNGETLLARVMNTLFTDVLTKPVQVVAAVDIGEFAAKAFEDPQTWSKKTFSLAGDEISPQQLQEVYASVKGKSLPTTYSILARLLTYVSKEVGTMFRFFNTSGYTADIAEARRLHPGLSSFKDFAQQSL